MLKFNKNVLIDELYKGKKFNGKKLFKINALLLPNYKSHLKAKKKHLRVGNGPKLEFEICEFLLFFYPPYHALTFKHCCVWCKWDGMVGSDGYFLILVYYYSWWSSPFDVMALMTVISFSWLVFSVMVNSLFWCIHHGDGRLLLLIYCTWCWSSPFSHMLYLVMVISFFWCVGPNDGHFFLFICYS